jgi:hypothetical protein
MRCGVFAGTNLNPDAVSMSSLFSIARSGSLQAVAARQRPITASVDPNRIVFPRRFLVSF